jgi:GTP-binding protein
VPVDTPDIKGEYDILVNELTKYNPEMLDKERLLVISKIDMLDDELRAELKAELDVSFKEVPYMFISSVAQIGLTELKDKLWKMLND